jgi:signal recognition particle receptor subunit beta
MDNILRIVVTGPVGAGKSTFIRTISEIEVVDTDCKATDEVAELKQSTTVSMDFGRLRIGEEEEEMWLHLYGTPGQARFRLYVGYFNPARSWLRSSGACPPAWPVSQCPGHSSLYESRTRAPSVIGITHVDHPNAWDPEDILLILNNQDGSIPHTTLNAQEPASVANTLLLLVEQLMPQVVVPAEDAKKC